MTLAHFELVVQIHLIGSATATKAVWERMSGQAYGRVLMTASSTWLYDNFSQANFAAAKPGVVGFAKTLALEVARHEIRVNTVAPVAATCMTAGVGGFGVAGWRALESRAEPVRNP